MNNLSRVAVQSFTFYRVLIPWGCIPSLNFHRIIFSIAQKPWGRGDPVSEFIQASRVQGFIEFFDLHPLFISSPPSSCLAASTYSRAPSFFSARRDLFKAAFTGILAIAPLPPSLFRAFFFCTVSRMHVYSSFYSRTNRSESSRRNGINSRFADLLAIPLATLPSRFIPLHIISSRSSILSVFNCPATREYSVFSIWRIQTKRLMICCEYQLKIAGNKGRKILRDGV